MPTGVLRGRDLETYGTISLTGSTGRALTSVEITPATIRLTGTLGQAITLRLPLSSVVIALLLSSSAGLAVAPLVIVAVVVAYLATLTLAAYVDVRLGREPVAEAGGSRAR